MFIYKYINKFSRNRNNFTKKVENLMFTEKWIKKSEHFQKNAKNCFLDNLYDLACFSAQQAIEFFLKGIIIYLTGHKPYIHSLNNLIQEIISLGFQIPQNIIESINSLEEHYMQARYPDSRLNDYTKNEAENAIKNMEVVLNFLNKFYEQIKKAK